MRPRHARVRVPLVRDARQERPEQILEAREVVRAHQAAQLLAPRRDRDARRNRLQQERVQAALHLLVGVVQLVEARVLVPLLADDGQVAGLEQKRLDGDAVDVDGRKQVVVREHALQGRRREPAPRQKVGEEGRRAALEPVRAKIALVEQQQDVERVVDSFRPEPVVAIVPAADLVPVQALQFRGEDRVQIVVRVAAKGTVALVQRDVVQIVQARENARSRELAHPRQENETELLVAVLDRPVQAAQEVPVGPRQFPVAERVQDRLVVLVHQNDHLPPGALVQGLDQFPETVRGLGGPRFEARAPLRRRQLSFHGYPNPVRDDEIAPAEAEPHDRVARRPVPLAVHGEAPEQLLASLEQFLQGVHQKGLAEPART